MKKLIAMLIAIVMILSLAACGNSGAAGGEDLGPIKIGSIQDLTGGASSSGQPQAWGVEHAVKWINDNGGINGRQIELYTRDCQNDAEVGVTAYRELVDEVGVCAIIGPALSNPASAWVELATEDKMPIVGHFMDEVCTTNPETGEVYPYMFLAEPSCSYQSYIVGEYAMEELGVKSVATLYNPSNAFAAAHEAPLVDYIEAHGGSVAARETFGWSDGDYTAQAQKIADLNPDAVFLCDYLAQVTTAYDNLRDAGYKGIILGANTLAASFPDLVKNDIYDVYLVQNYELDKGKIGEITDAHMAETGTNFRSTNAGFGWDAMMVLFNAMKQAKDPTNGEEVRGILENNTKDVELCGIDKITLDPATHRPTVDMGMYMADYDENRVLRIIGHYTTDYTGK